MLELVEDTMEELNDKFTAAVLLTEELGELLAAHPGVCASLARARRELRIARAQAELAVARQKPRKK